jgi:hypothetical protein
MPITLFDLISGDDLSAKKRSGSWSERRMWREEGVGRKSDHRMKTLSAAEESFRRESGEESVRPLRVGVVALSNQPAEPTRMLPDLRIKHCSRVAHL